MVTPAELDELERLAANTSRLLKNLAPAPTVPDWLQRAQADRIADAVPRLVAEVRRLAGKAGDYECDWYAAKSEFGEAMAKARECIRQRERETLDACAELDDVRASLSTAEAERDRLRKLFDDAGRGEHNVLALIDHYQAETIAEEERRRTAEAERLTLARAIRGGNAHLDPAVNELAARIVKEASE